MTKFKTLLKINLLQAYRPKKNTTKKTMPIWVIYIILGVCFVPVLVSIFGACLSLGEFLAQPQNLKYLGVCTTFLITAVELVNVFFGFKSMLGTVYMTNDSDMLLALPVKPIVIFFSKLAVCYIVEFFSTVLLLLVTLLPLGIGLSAGIGYFLALIFGAFLIPLISLLAVSILSIPLLLVSNLFRNRGALGTVVYVLLFGAIMGVYFWFVTRVTDFGDGTEIAVSLEQILVSLESTARYLFPNVWLSAAFSATTFEDWIVNFLLFLLCALVLLVLAGLLSNRVFLSNMRKSQETGAKNKKGSYKFVGGNKITSLFVADFKNIMRNSSLGFTCLSQVIMVPLFVAIYCLGIGDVSNAGKEGLTDMLASICKVTLLLMGLMTGITASCSVSREGENFYLIKTLPITAKQFAAAKLLIVSIFNVVAFAIAVVIEALILKNGFLDSLLEFLMVLFASLGVASLQVLIDMKNPRLKWTSVQQGLKNNPSSLWGLLIGFVTGTILSVIVVLFVLYGRGTIGLLISTLLSVGICVAGVLILFNNCEKYFNAVE